MNFIISSATLYKSLQSISGVITSNSVMPIIENFLFEIADGNLTITATDNDTRASVKVLLSMSEGEGKVAVPNKILMETLKTFPDVPINFKINEDNYLIEITAGEGNYKMSGYNAENFPEMPSLENAENITVNSMILQNAIAKTIFAVGNDEIRPQLLGVNFECTESGLRIAATDAHKLVRFRRNDVKSDSTFSFIVKRKPLNLLKSLFGALDTDVKLKFNNTNVAFDFDHFHITCRLLEGKFPNYESVIPKENPNKLIVDRSSLINTLRRVAIYSNQSTFQVRLNITGQELMVTAEDVDYSNEAKERLACNYEGNDIEIGFNSKFLLEMLTNLECQNVSFYMSTHNRAALIIPDETNSEEEDVLMLLMPIMLGQ